MRIPGKPTICEQQNANQQRPSPGSKIGIALGTIGQTPINGLRQNPENGTNGWYIWCGTEFSLADDFFSPLHIEHISNHLPQVTAYLDLPPGYRFLIDGLSFEDIWFDPDLLNA